MTDDLETLDAACERAESALLSAIRRDAPRSTLAEAAHLVSLAADAWNAEAYRLFHGAAGDRRKELDYLTERTEVLSELWTDVAAAFARDS